MPLSEHEQKLLDQMERALYAEDPSFATQMKGHSGPGVTSRTRLVIGIIVAMLGLAVVVFGVSAASIPVGIVGFVVMVAGVAWAATPQRGPRATAPSRSSAQRRVGRGRAGKGARKPAGRSSFMQKLDGRWEKRRREGL